MRDEEFYEKFAAAWIEAWNSHDLHRILSHYEDSLVFTSPVLVKLMPESGGKLHSKKALGAYWSKALAAVPDLYFEPIAVLKGVDSAVIHYKGHGSKLCAEFFVFSANGLVVESHAHSEF